MRNGSVTVKIYRQIREKEGRKYHSFPIDYTDGKRTLKAFADYEKAHEEATRIAGKLAQGEITVLQLTGADRAAYGQALVAIKPTATSLELAAKEFAEAHRILGGQTSLIEPQNLRQPPSTLHWQRCL